MGSLETRYIHEVLDAGRSESLRRTTNNSDVFRCAASKRSLAKSVLIEEYMRTDSRIYATAYRADVAVGAIRRCSSKTFRLAFGLLGYT